MEWIIILTVALGLVTINKDTEKYMELVVTLLVIIIALIVIFLIGVN